MTKQLAETVSEEERALARELGREMARAHLGMIAYYRDSLKLGSAEAEARATDGARADEVIHKDTAQISWWDFNALVERDVVAAQALWDRIADEARDELASGDRAAKVLEFDGSPWERARFLVLRSAFRKDWQPRGGIESALVDTLAQAYCSYEYWLAQLRFHSTIEGKRQRGLAAREDGKWEPPTLTVAEAVEQSAAMAERFHRMFLRTVRALRDLRRLPVVVTNADRVNIAERQVNISA